MPKCKAYLLVANNQLELVAELPSNATFGPCAEVRSFQTAGGGTVSTRVPLCVSVPQLPECAMVWVHLTSGDDALAVLTSLDLPNEDDIVTSDAETR